jgi:hypothetical protein
MQISRKNALNITGVGDVATSMLAYTSATVALHRTTTSQRSRFEGKRH